MMKLVLFYSCAAFVLVSPHPLLQQYQQQCQCPVNSHPQNQLLNVPSDLPHQHTVTTPQLVNQAYNALIQNPHQCIPVKDQENKQFLNKILENPLIKALQEQNRQQYQKPVQNPVQHPHVVNNYFIIPTEALLSEEDEKNKKVKGNHGRKEEKKNKEHTNHGPNGDSISKSNKDETHAFLDEYLNQEPHNKENHPSANSHIVQTKKTTELQKCSKNEQPIEVALEPTFAKIQEYHEPKAVIVPTHIEAEEAVIQDVKNKFPNMPEALVRSLVSVIRPRFQRFNPYQNHRHPHRQRPITCEHGNSTIDETGNYWHQRPGPRRPLRRNANRKRKGSNRNTTINSEVEDTTKKIDTLDLKEATRVKPTVTEFYRNDETTTENHKHAESKDINKSNEIENTTPHVIYANHHNIELPELGSEDIIPNVDNGINDDYYPDFTKDNNAHSVSNAFYNYPEFYDEVRRSERKISDARESHRSKIVDGKKAPKKVMKKQSERQSKGKYISERRHDDKSEEIIYRVPPGLESPDFKTINVREYHSREHQRPSYFSHEVGNSQDRNEGISENELKSSNNEHVITYYLPSKSAEPNSKRPIERLETVFANSKIVNYGHSPDIFDGETTTIFSVDLGTDGTKNPFGDEAVVTARTIVESEEFNW